MRKNTKPRLLKWPNLGNGITMIRLFVNFGIKKYFDTVEGFPTYVRMMFLSVDDKAMYKDFFGELSETWNEAMKVYNSVPEVVDDEWFEENGFERF